MIEIIQAGQFGKTKSLIDMHKVRKLIFKDKMQWDVAISKEGLEIDNYDLPETVYILVRDNKNRVSGVWRMLPSSSPSMIKDIWPEFLENFPMHTGNDVWELSRFGVHTYADSPKEHVRNVNQITAKLIIALLKICTMTEINNVYTMYNTQIGRAVGKIGFFASETSDALPIMGKPSVVGRIKTDIAALKRVQNITEVEFNLGIDDLPPILRKRFVCFDNSRNKEKVYV